MSTFASLTANAAAFLTWLEGWAVNQHQKTDDAGFAAIARMAGKIGAVITAPENAADIAAIGKMAAQDLPSLVTPAPELPDPPSDQQPTADYAGAHGGSMYSGPNSVQN